MDSQCYLGLVILIKIVLHNVYVHMETLDIEILNIYIYIKLQVSVGWGWVGGYMSNDNMQQLNLS